MRLVIGIVLILAVEIRKEDATIFGYTSRDRTGLDRHWLRRPDQHQVEHSHTLQRPHFGLIAKVLDRIFIQTRGIETSTHMMDKRGLASDSMTGPYLERAAHDL